MVIRNRRLARGPQGGMLAPPVDLSRDDSAMNVKLARAVQPRTEWITRVARRLFDLSPQMRLLEAIRHAARHLDERLPAEPHLVADTLFATPPARP